MFKKIFKAAKDLIRSPVGQLGIGLLAPQLSFLKGVSPALIQGGIGLLSGAKPEDVLRGVALGAGSAALMGGRGGISDFFRGQQPATQIGSALKTPSGGSMSISPNVKGTGFSIGDASASGYSANSMTPNTFADMSTSINLNPTNVSSPAASQGILRDMGLIVDTVTDEISGKPRPANFFEKYGNIVKLGTAGASIAAAALGAEDASKLYDPEKNPYLKSGTGSKDFYEGMNPIYSANGGVASFAKGGIDNLRKSGMVYGPGGPKDDLIDAKLSNGEFVFTAAAVDRAGGPQAMYKLMNSLDPESEKPGEARGIERV